VIETAVSNVSEARQGIKLDLVLDPQAAMVSGDPVRLQQIVSNLLVNAVKFTPSGGTVEVRLSAEIRVRVVVHDTGRASIGVPALCVRPLPPEDTTETRRHDGLGLPECATWSMHNGSISVEPGRGPGATSP
jgi:signal transduction histidine kinase